MHTHTYMHTHTHTHTHTEYYSAIQKNEILPFATTWMDLQSIMLSDHRYREQTSGYQRGGGLVAK